MKRTLIGIGLTGTAVALAVVLTGAQTAGTRERAPRGGAAGIVEQQGPRRGPGDGQFRGRFMQGRGPAMAGRGPGFGRGPGGPGRGGGGALAALKLTDEQRTRITDLHRAERDQSGPIRDELQITRKALHRELFADARDNGKVAELAATATKLEGRLAELHLKTSAAVADLLTAEQRETMRLKDGRGGPGREGRGPRGAGVGR